MALIVSWVQGQAQEMVNPFDVHVNVTTNQGQFQINASYTVPINLCSAYAFLTDYEGAEQAPGIIESTILARDKNKVRVRRVVEEQVLFFPVEIRSVLEYTETPSRLLSFEQISGDNKLYRGSWKLAGDNERTTFNYEALVEPNSVIPIVVIEYFVKNSIRDRFESMAYRATQKKPSKFVKCNLSS